MCVGLRGKSGLSEERVVREGGWVIDGSISVDLGGNLEGIWVESEDGFGLASNTAQSGAWRASNDVIYGFRQPRIVIYRRDGDVRRRVSF